MTHVQDCSFFRVCKHVGGRFAICQSKITPVECDPFNGCVLSNFESGKKLHYHPSIVVIKNCFLLQAPILQATISDSTQMPISGQGTVERPEEHQSRTAAGQKFQPASLLRYKGLQAITCSPFLGVKRGHGFLRRDKYKRWDLL